MFILAWQGSGCFELTQELKTSEYEVLKKHLLDALIIHAGN